MLPFFFISVISFSIKIYKYIKIFTGAGEFYFKMSIDTQTVHHVAQLARLKISDEENALYAEQLSRILNLMEQLNQCPTDNVSPMSHAVTLRMPEREDRVLNNNTRSHLLRGTPSHKNGYFCVPKIIVE